MSAERDPVADRLALRELADGYAVAIDDRDVDTFLGLFADDAVLEIYPAGADAPEATYAGRDGLADVFDLLGRWEATSHHMAGQVCRLEGDRAEGQVHCLAHHLHAGEDGTRCLVMVIRYRDRFARYDQGWRFAHREVRIAWTEDRPASIAPSF